MALTILLRTSYRPTAFARCVASIDYPAKVIVSYDDKRAESYIDGHTTIELSKNQHKFGYNLYLNVLTAQLQEGHAVYLDDDDTCIPGALEALDKMIQPGKSYIVPFLRDGKQKPWNSLFRNNIIQEGCIGLPCLILWHEHKKYVRFDHTELADFNAIKMLSQRVRLEWVNLPVVNSPARGWGKME